MDNLVLQHYLKGSNILEFENTQNKEDERLFK